MPPTSPPRSPPSIPPLPAASATSARNTGGELERRLAACPTLPTLPAVALQVMRLCQAEEIDLWQVAQALSSDPSLSARVLRAANSASLAARGKVSTVNRAVALLGTKAVVSLTLSFSLLRCRRTDDSDGLDRGAFWRRAVFSALAARSLAEVAAVGVDPEEAFVAALLQDLGMLALAEVFRTRYAQLCNRAGRDHAALAAMERELWGADHAAASAFLARAWQLPQLLVDAVGESHGDFGPNHRPAPGRPQATLSHCVALSGPMADAWVAPAGLETALALDATRVHVHLSPAVLEAVVARMALAVPETSADFEIELGGAGRVDEVLREARQLLVDKGLALPIEQRPVLISADTPFAVAFGYGRSHAEPLALMAASCTAAPGAPPPDLASFLRRGLRAIDLVQITSHGDALALLPATGQAGTRAVAERLMRLATGEGLGQLHLGFAASTPSAPAPSLEALHVAAASALATAFGRGGGLSQVCEAPPFAAAGTPPGAGS